METYTLQELTERAGRALDALGVRVGNRRVRQRPDARTVRYYSQVGLVDRPLPVAGREARYGRRHLVQLVAVKRLQSAGVPLAEVQRRLAGATDDELLEAIGPSAGEALAAAPQAGAEEPPVARRAGTFWRARPAAVDGARRDAVSRDGVREVLVLRLAPGVELAVDAAVAGHVDVETMRAAAQPLVQHLRTSTTSSGFDSSGFDNSGFEEDGE